MSFIILIFQIRKLNSGYNNSFHITRLVGNRTKIWLFCLHILFYMMPYSQITLVQNRKAQKAFYQKHIAIMIGSSICRMWHSYSIYQVGWKCLRDWTQIFVCHSSVLEKTRLIRTYCKKKSLLHIPSFQFESLNLWQLYKEQVLGWRCQCPWIGTSGASLSLLSSILKSLMLDLHLLKESHTFSILLSISDAVSFNQPISIGSLNILGETVC